MSVAEAGYAQAPVPGQLTIESSREEDKVFLALVGELDLASAPHFEHELEGALASAPNRVVIDLRRLEFMDSSGLQALLRANERANSNGHVLMLRPGPHQVQRVFELTKTIDVFSFEH